MKMFVCNVCDYAFEKLSFRNSFRRAGHQLCRSCGGMLQEKEVSSEDMEKLKTAHSKWAFLQVIRIDVVFWILVIIGVIAAVSRNGLLS